MYKAIGRGKRTRQADTGRQHGQFHWGSCSTHRPLKKGGDVGRMAGQPARLRFGMKDADLHSFQFTTRKE
ncbi:MAG TPA: hypothetical protein DCY79_00625 [Planctomycetaceae bacterium]|nr:hypothetical protein [Blastopirellula sp.]HAY78290.1 hypothetical protein [Planctomycetaceae bacterium]